MRVEVLAVKLDLAAGPFEEVNELNTALQAGQRVVFAVDQDLPQAADYIKKAADIGVALVDLSELSYADHYDAAVVITDKDLYMVKPHIYLRPATLAIGINCARETTSAAVFAAIANACRRIGRSAKSTAIISTPVGNQDVIGLLAATQQLEVPVKFFSPQQINTDVAAKHVTPVEACALLGSHGNKLISPQSAYENVEIAVAEVKLRWWD
jgi:cobalt-precorrin 5A hydrolase